MKNLKIYQLAVEFYHKTKKLYLKEPFKNQFEKSVTSIVLNIAEGSAKPTAKDRRKFYYISLGSLRETQAILEMIDNEELAKECDILGGYLYKLCKNT